MMTILRHRHFGSDLGFYWGQAGIGSGEWGVGNGEGGFSPTPHSPLPTPRSVTHRLHGGVRPGFEWGIIVCQDYGPVARQFEPRCEDGFDVAGSPDLFRELQLKWRGGLRQVIGDVTGNQKHSRNEILLLAHQQPV